MIIWVVKIFFVQFFCVFLPVKVKSLNRVRLFVTPWTVVYQALPSMGFSRQEYGSGLPFPSPGIFPTQGSNPGLPHCRQMLTLWATREVPFLPVGELKCKSLCIPIHCFVHFKMTLLNFSFPACIWTSSKAFYFVNSSRIILTKTFQTKFTIPVYCLQYLVHCTGYSPFFSGEIGQNMNVLNSPVKVKIISHLTRWFPDHGTDLTKWTLNTSSTYFWSPLPPFLTRTTACIIQNSAKIMSCFILWRCHTLALCQWKY